MSQAGEHVTIGEKLSYGAGDIASNLFWTTFTTYVAIFYTDVFGILPAAAATMLLVTRVWDAAIDPLMGMIADRTKTRWGRFRPWLLWMAVPFGLIGVLCFTTPDLGLAGKLVYAYVTYTLMMMVYTAINIPYSALMGVLTSSSRQRTIVSSYRFVCAFASAALVQWATPHLVDYLGGGNQEIVSASVVGRDLELAERGTGIAKLKFTAEDPQGRRASAVVYVKVLAAGEDDAGPSRLGSVEVPALHEGFSCYRIDLAAAFANALEGAGPSEWTYSVSVIDQRRGYQRTMTVYAAAAVLLFLVTFFGTRERVQPDPRQKTSLRQDLTDLGRNGPWIVLVFLGLFKLIFLSVRMGSMAYYCKYFVGSEMLVASVLGVGTVAQITGVSLTKWFVMLLGKRNTYLAAMAVGTVLTIAFYFVGAEQTIAIFVLHAAIMFFLGPTSPLVWAMYADAADYSEWRTGRRATGLVFSAASFAQKLGGALGGSLALWLLVGFGYEANVSQTEQSLRGIVLMISIIPAVFSLLAFVTAWLYPLDEKTMGRIEADLAQRKATGDCLDRCN
jgi:glycoside/pentoside/hexuronide:cation symporter, GPH family